MRRIDDPAAVREQYATEAGLAARMSIYQEVTGPDAREMLFAAVAERDPECILEVGCGEGELAERMTRELRGSVIALDQSERMVELTSARGVDARVGQPLLQLRVLVEERGEAFTAHTGTPWLAGG